MSQSTVCEELKDFLENKACNSWKFFTDVPFYGVTICDHNGFVVFVNAAHKHVAGIAAKDMIGSLMVGLEGSLIDKAVTGDVIMTQKSIVREQEMYLSKRKNLVYGQPIFDEEGTLRYVVSLSLDITLEQQMRRKLQQANANYIEMRHQTEKLEKILESQTAQRASDERPEMLYKSLKMENLVNLINHISDADSPVLIYGESGVGKELVAQTVHKTSNRKAFPFVDINSAAIPPTLLESELFGYEAGAFTGSNAKGKKGLFESAEGGTLLLDEISELSLELQAKLLRVLQEKKIRRVGGTQNIDIDVRIIAATNKNLEAMVEQERFRKDLFYRLNVIPLHVPPLRERKEDIPILTYFFLDKFNKKYSKNKSIETEGYICLVDLPYDGNVRQLENTIERLVLLCQHDEIVPEDILRYYYMVADTAKDNHENAEISYKSKLKGEEDTLLLNLSKKGLSTYQMAEYLGISQSTVWRKLKQLKQQDN